ncbi:homeobox domain protein [Ceratobasidium sp. AG-Ba]|nr:homeobox domain protein [Ceratobasidium sp. AG-Ba]
MNNSLIHSVRATVQKYASFVQDQLPPPHSHRPRFDPRSVHSAPTNLPNVAASISALGLPPAASQELTSLFEQGISGERGFVEQTHRRLLEELSTLSVSSDPMAVSSFLRSALDALHCQSINARMDALQHEIATLELNSGSASESDDSSDSDDDSTSGDEDEEEEMEDVAEEDDNSPAKPGEDVPPLDTKYLPIFEALHERGKVLTKPEKTYLVEMTGMTYRQITIWFQNRRRGELKEDMHARASSSHLASVHSDASSDDSEDELDLERRVATTPLDTSFNIRSWCEASAAATKNDAHVPPLPPSPTKFGFGPTETTPSFVSDDSDLSDTDDETGAPPGLRVPSLAMSVTTLDSGSDRGPFGSSGTFPEPAIANGSSSPTNSLTGSRPVKALPSRRPSPPAQPPAQPQQTSAFNFNFNASAPAPFATSAPTQPAQFVTSNERGLTLEMDTTPPRSTTTLQSAAPISTNLAASSTVSPSSPPMSGGSRTSTPSPSSSGQSATSPRPAVKPLPRRTGCAPRPRPPPRATSAATGAPATATTTSARPSIVLPPSSNPSLASTTLSALLRPNLPPPKIPVEMEERLSAMAGRMGVGAGGSAQAAPSRGPSFSFGPTSMPGALAPISEQNPSA